MITKTHTQNEIRTSLGLSLSGHVRIENGDTVIEGKNKMSNNLVVSLASIFGSHTCAGDHVPFYNPFTYCYFALGTDTQTPTTVSTAGLISPIGAPTKPTGYSRNYWVDGYTYYVMTTVTWDPGTVTGTVGELGLFAFLRNTLQAVQGSYSASSGQLLSRISVADGELTAFTIDTTKPVVVSWTLKIETDGKLGYYGLMFWASYFNINTISNGSGMPCYNWVTKSSFLVLGSNTANQTTPAMTALVSPIGASPGTKPNTQSISNTTVGAGEYKVTLTGTWNAGTVSGTVGEIGHYGWACTSFWHTTTGGPYLFFRLSNADSDFQSFQIDTQKALTITIDVTFKWV